MIIQSECIPCQVQVRYRDLAKLVSSEEDRIEFLKNIAKLLIKELDKGNRSAPLIATKLYRYIKSALKNEDPYWNEKIKANLEGLRLYEKFRELLENSDDELILAVKIALIGNSIDFGVAQYDVPKIEELCNALNYMRLHGINNLQLLNNVENKLILYLMDNSGEAALDKILAEVLRRRRAKVIGVVKGGAFQNDVTIREVDMLRLHESFDEIVSTGTDAASIFIDEISEELKKYLMNCDLIIAKGMAHLEYITEIQRVIDKPVMYLVKAKCRPIANYLKVNVGDYVIHLER